MRKLHHLSATALLLIGCGPVAGGWATSLSGLDSDRNVILSIFGQSLGNGGQGFGPVDTTQYGSNERYVLGSGFRPLVEDCDGEGVCSGPSMGTLVESPLSPIANQFRYVTGRDVIGINDSVSGACYDEIGPGTTSYNNRLAKIAAIQAARGPAVLPYVAVLHGQCDTSINGETEYAAKLTALQAALDYAIRFDTSSPGYTGQTTPVTLVVVLMNSPGAYDKDHNVMADLGQLLAENPYIVVVGDMSKWLTPADDRHLVAAAYQQLGILMGDWMGHAGLGSPWSAIRPASSVLSGNTLAATFSGVQGHLVLDRSGSIINTTGLVDDGFALYGAPGITVTSVSTAAVDGINITGSAAFPTTTRHAGSFTCPDPHTTCTTAWHGRNTGPRTTLRDSVAIANYAGVTVYRWALTYGPGEDIPTGGVATTLVDNDWRLKLDSTDGSDDYEVALNDSATDAPTNKLTGCALVELTAVASPGEGIMAKSARGAFSWALYSGYGVAGVNGLRVFFALSSNATQAGQAPAIWVATAQLAVTPGVEQHVCVVYDGTYNGSDPNHRDRVSFYIDGSPVARDTTVGAGTVPAALYHTTGGLTFGRFRAGNGVNYNIPKGFTDRKVIWPAALTASQIATYHNGGVARTPVGINAVGPCIWRPTGEYHKYDGRETGTQDFWSGKRFIRQDYVPNSAPGYESTNFSIMGDPEMVRRP